MFVYVRAPTFIDFFCLIRVAKSLFCSRTKTAKIMYVYVRLCLVILWKVIEIEHFKYFIDPFIQFNNNKVNNAYFIA